MVFSLFFYGRDTNISFTPEIWKDYQFRSNTNHSREVLSKKYRIPQCIPAGERVAT